MATKVGDIYVDLGVKVEGADKAASSLARAFGKLSKSAFSIRPRLDRGAVAEIGKAGSALSRSLSKSFEKAGQTRVWTNLERSATAAFKGAQREAEMLDRRVQEIYKSTTTGAKYWKSYMDAANPKEAEARLQAFNNALNKSKASAVLAAKEQAAAAQATAAKYGTLASTAQRSLATLTGSTDRATQAILRMPPSIQRVANSLNNGLGRAFENLASSAERGAGRASGAMESFQGKTEKAFGVVRFLSYQAISAIERMAGAFLRAGFKSAAAIGYTQAALEQIQINIAKTTKGFEGMSNAQFKAADPKAWQAAQQQADRLTQSFIQFSQQTPYALDQIQEIGQQLAIAQNGLKDSTGSTFDLMGVMRSLGDVASATGKSVEGMRSGAYVLQQIGQSGEIMGDDLRQLHNAIPNWREIIATQMGKPVKDITNDVAKSTEGINALFQGLGKGEIGEFGGVLRAQNATVAGQFERMVETVHNGVGQIINSLAPVLQPAFHEAGNLFAGLTRDAVTALQSPKVQGAMKNFTKGVRDTFSDIGAAGQSSGIFDSLGKAAQQVLPMLAKSFQNVQTLVQNFFKGFQAGGGAAQFQTLIGNITKAVQELWPVFQQVANSVMNVLGPAFTSIGNQLATTLLPALNSLIPILIPIGKFLLQIFGGAVIGVIKGFVGVLRGAINIISGIINVFVGLLTGNWSQAWNGLKQILTGALQAIVGAIRIWLNIGILNLIRGGFLKLLPALFRAGWGVIRGTFSAGIKGVGALMRALPGILRNLAVDSMHVMQNAFTAGRSKVLGIFRAMPGLFVAALRALGGLLAAVGRAALTAMAAAVKAYAHVVISAAKTILTRIPAALAGAASGLSSVGSDIVAGIAQGIENGFSIVSGALGRLKDKVLSKAKSLFKIGSPSKVMEKEIGKWIPAGIAVGIDSNFKTVSKALTNLAIKVGKAGEKAASKIVKSFSNKMNGLARQMDFANGLVTAGKKRLDELKGIQKSYIDVFDGFTDLGSMGNRTDAEGNQTWNFSDALTDLKAARVEAVKIADLGKRAIGLGLDRGTLDHILQLGPDQAAQWLQGIVSGGKSAASQVDAYFDTFTKSGRALGDSVIKTFEHSSIAAADAFVTRWQSKQATLQKQFEALGDALGAALVKQLNKTKGGINVGYGPPKKKKPKKAIGSMSFGGGRVVVGEHGREVLDLPPRTRIHTNHASERMIDNGPVELSDESVARLAAAILAGASMVSTRTTQAALTGLAVRS